MTKKAMLALACLLFAQHAFAHEVLTVRVGDYPPAYYKDNAGQWVGMEIDVLQAVCKEAKIHCKYEEMPWARAVEKIKIGDLDIMLAMSRTSDREKVIDYIGPSRYEQMVLIVDRRNVGLKVQSLDDLAKLPEKIGIQNNTEYPTLSERLRADTAFEQHFEYVADQNLNLKKLSAQRIVGFFEDKNFAAHAIRTMPEYRNVAVHSFALSDPKPVYITVSLKVNEGLRNRMRQAYQRLEQQGHFKKVWKKWAGEPAALRG